MTEDEEAYKKMMEVLLALNEYFLKRQQWELSMDMEGIILHLQGEHADGELG